MPKVTVLLPVYNGEAFLEEAVNSVLRQSFRDFELLIMDDGSTDNTLSVAGRFKDPRIRLEKRQHDFIGNLEYREVFYSFNVRKRLYGGAA